MKDIYEFNEAKHIHSLNGQALTGVTTILGVIAKPMLIQWSANMAVESIKGQLYDLTLMPPRTVLDDIFAMAKVAHRKKKEEAGVKGTDVHAEVELLIKQSMATGLMSYAGDNEQVKHFIKWSEDNKVKFIGSE